MKIAVMSDLHLEWTPEWLPMLPEIDVIVAAGDIYSGTKAIEWLKQVSRGIPVIYVLGNHEAYGFDRNANLTACKALATGSNVHVLENESIIINGIRFLGSTLFTDFDLFGNGPLDSIKAQGVVSDFKHVTVDGRPLQAYDMVGWFNESKNWLGQELANAHTPTIVVTHYAPSIYSRDSRFSESWDVANYCNRLENMINYMGPNLWIHGHIHDQKDYMIGDTRIVCNPKGYDIPEGYAPMIVEV